MCPPQYFSEYFAISNRTNGPCELLDNNVSALLTETVSFHRIVQKGVKVRGLETGLIVPIFQPVKIKSTIT